MRVERETKRIEDFRLWLLPQYETSIYLVWLGIRIKILHRYRMEQQFYEVQGYEYGRHAATKSETTSSCKLTYRKILSWK